MFYRAEYTPGIANAADQEVAPSEIRTEVDSSVIRFTFQVSLEQKHHHIHTKVSSLKPMALH